MTISAHGREGRGLVGVAAALELGRSLRNDVKSTQSFLLG